VLAGRQVASAALVDRKWLAVFHPASPGHCLRHLGVIQSVLARGEGRAPAGLG